MIFSASTATYAVINEPEEITPQYYEYLMDLQSNAVKANELLFEPFGFEAEVRKGDQRGRTIGFPTINQKYPDELVKLKFGVYKVKVIVQNQEYIGMCDIGNRPTYPTNEVIVETFIKDFSGDLYFKNVKIVPIEFLREEKKFESLEDLKNQIILPIEE